MRNVLLLAYHFPPGNSSATRRAGGMAKYLPAFGWRPVVVSHLWTPQNCLFDPEFVQNMPEDTMVTAVPSSPAGEDASGYTRLAGLSMARLRYLLTPTSYPWGWTRTVKQRLPRILCDHPPDALWATCGPWASLSLADHIRRRAGVPWVADFRDIFDQFDGPMSLSRRFWRRWRALLERRTVRSASAITAVTEGLQDRLEARHRRPVSLIRNGFDPDDMAGGDAAPIPRFNLVYTGSIFPQGSPRVALDAMAILLRSGLVNEADVAVDFYGWCAEDLRHALLEGYACPQIVSFSPSVLASECAAICRASAVLLQPGHPQHNGIMTGKIYEYLAAQRPILCTPSDGGCIASLLRETGAGAACGTVQETADLLLTWYREWKATGTVRYGGRREAIMKYSRKRRAGELADVLDAIADAREQPRSDRSGELP